MNECDLVLRESEYYLRELAMRKLVSRTCLTQSYVGVNVTGAS